jgi:MFS family permease
MMIQMASSNTILQTLVDDDKRGRVISFYTMAFMGTAPFGSFLAGGLSKIIGAPNTVLIGGISCIIGALFFTRKLPELKKIIHPIYVRLGFIAEEVSIGIQTATELTIPPEE